MLISYHQALRCALQLLQCSVSQNPGLKPCLFVHDDNGVLLGSLTDGDIRRYLINGSLDDAVYLAANPSTHSLPVDCDRFELSQCLYLYRLPIPIVDSNNRIVRIEGSFFSLPSMHSFDNVVSSSYPLRLSLLGGGLDQSSILNSYSHDVLLCPLSLRVKVSIGLSRHPFVSINGKQVVSVSSLPDHNINNLARSDQLCVAVLKYFDHHKTGTGLLLDISSPVYSGSGLGASSAIMVAIITAYIELFKLQIRHSDIPSVAFQIERVLLGLPGGWQDHFAPLARGLSLVRFRRAIASTLALSIPDSLLIRISDAALFFRTVFSRDEVISDVSEPLFPDVDDSVREACQNIERAIHALSSCRLNEFYEILDEQWQIKVKSHCGSMPPHILNAIDRCKEIGAHAGKLVGRGHAGYIVVFSPINIQNQIKVLMSELGFIGENISISPFGGVTYRDILC